MAGVGEGTIEVSGYSQNTSDDTLLFYFENKRRSGGGDIVESDNGFRRKGNRCYITFQNPSVVQSVLSRASHVLNGRTLQIKTVRPAEIDNNKLVIKNISEHTTKDGLGYFLKDLTKSKVLNIAYLNEDKNCAIITFAESINVQNIVAKNEKSPAILDGISLTLLPLEETCVLQVSGLPDSVTPDWLELYFESKKRSGGADGAVEKVEMPDRDVAIVTFKSPKIVKSILKRTHKYNTHLLHVSPFYNCMEENDYDDDIDVDIGSDQEEQNDTSIYEHTYHAPRRVTESKTFASPAAAAPSSSQPLDYKLPIDADLMDFIESNRVHRDEFKKTMHRVNAVVIPGNDDNIIIVSPSKSIRGKSKIHEWETQTQDTLFKFVNQFSIYEKQQVPTDIWLNHSSMLDELSTSVKTIQDKGGNSIRLIGKTVDVETAAAKLESAIIKVKAEIERKARQKTSKIARQSLGKLEMLQHDLEAIKKRLPSVDIRIDWKTMEVVFKGCAEDNTAAMCEVYESFNKFNTKRYDVHPSLAGFLDSRSGRQLHKEKLAKQNIHIGLDVDGGNVTIIAMSQNDIHTAWQALQRGFGVEEVTSKSDITAVFQKEDFTSMVAELESRYKVQINFGEKSVSVAGPSGDLKTVKKKLNDYIMANLKGTRFQKVGEDIIRFMRSHRSTDKIAEIQERLVRKSGRLVIKHNGFHIEGNPDVIDEALADLNKMIDAVERKAKTLKIKDKCECKLFSTDKGEQLVKSIETKVDCAIRIDKKGSFSSISRGSRPSLDTPYTSVRSSSSSSSVYTRKGKKIIVKQGSIADERVDSIVTSISGDLELRGGAAKAIFDKGGDGLVQKTRKLGLDKPGDVGYTSPGNLRCKEVMHCILGKWDKGQGEKTLRDVVRKCLGRAGRANHASIAIPSLGTGFLRFPHGKCAQILLEEIINCIDKYPSSSIKEFRFIVFDDMSVNAFESELSKLQDSATHTVDNSESRFVGDCNKQYGKVVVQIKQGDLTAADVDVIVNPVFSDNYEQGQIGNSIFKAAGSSLGAEYKSLKDDLRSGPIITGGGSLRRIQNVIHMVCPSASQLKQEIRQCLSLADMMEMNSIALPAIGTGRFGLSAGESAEGIIKGIESFTKNGNPQNLSRVEIVVFQASMVTEYARRLGTGSIITHGVTGDRKTVDSDAEVTITILSDNDKEIRKAEAEIKKILSEEITVDYIEDDILIKLERQDIHKLVSIGRENNVSVKFLTVLKPGFLPLTSSDKGKLQLRGLSIDVPTYKLEVRHWLQKYKKAKEIKKKVTWSFIDGRNRYPFDTIWNYELELARQNGEKMVCLNGEDGKPKFQVDIRAMTETNLRNHKKYALERDGPEELTVIFPDTWIPFPRGHLSREPLQVTLTAGSPEYQQVATTFNATADAAQNHQIVKIERIQHEDRFKGYSLKKKQLENKNKRWKNERTLYHGTKKDVVDKIIVDGFNRSYAGDNTGHWEGAGVYFAVKSGYSMKTYFSPVDGTGHRYIFQVKVLVGKWAKGKADMKEPPLKDANGTDRFDTTVDNETNPSMFVIFHDDQAYPEYLITFKT
ncbi:protein mono-ADP-ribosyltransferase PARP14-like [Saccoglossus kowalevskii]|uniref:Poly [ADP-ribose] polymerase n=1 Tax=Saccoglossus kowalevskii TaxID=10224 RepID=A0ABM0GLZ6_SACKO|nr:PREDICTED: poly [ADP-ribose] polymerase 14-like [Saccoglossus kowalevskii]